MGYELKNIDHFPQMIRDRQFGATPCQLLMPPFCHYSRIMFDFMVSLKSPCCAFKSQPKRTMDTINVDLLIVATPHGHGWP